MRFTGVFPLILILIYCIIMGKLGISWLKRFINQTFSALLFLFLPAIGRSMDTISISNVPLLTKVLVSSPDLPHVFFVLGSSSKKPVKGNMLSTVIAVKIGMVNLVERVSTSGILIPIVTNPSSYSAVYDAPERKSNVNIERKDAKARHVVQCRLDGVHAGAAEGGGVRALVVERVDVFV